MSRLLTILLAAFVPLPVAAGEPDAVADHVIIISVDGLRSDALLAVGRWDLPTFKRLCGGAWTPNARTDPNATVTLPNHTSMVTGRYLEGSAGHRWRANDWAPADGNLHQHTGHYVPSVFDVAHDHGVFTGLFVTKSKLALLDLSWDGDHGLPDATGDDDGRDKIDVFRHAQSAALEPNVAAATATNALLETLGGGHPRSLHLVHYRTPDTLGHEHGWDLTAGSPYLLAVAEVDREIGRVMAHIDADERLRGRTAIIVTTDHGGGAPFKSHTRAEMWVNYIIPFIVWTGEGSGADLYELNASTRSAPGLGRPGPAAAPPPIRNGEAGNLALQLLGLPPIPGSTLNAAHDLRVR